MIGGNPNVRAGVNKQILEMVQVGHAISNELVILVTLD